MVQSTIRNSIQVVNLPTEIFIQPFRLAEFGHRKIAITTVRDVQEVNGILWKLTIII